jgi:hypothetical protein
MGRISLGISFGGSREGYEGYSKDNFGRYDDGYL